MDFAKSDLTGLHSTGLSFRQDSNTFAQVHCAMCIVHVSVYCASTLSQEEDTAAFVQVP